MMYGFDEMRREYYWINIVGRSHTRRGQEMKSEGGVSTEHQVRRSTFEKHEQNGGDPEGALRKEKFGTTSLRKGVHNIIIIND